MAPPVPDLRHVLQSGLGVGDVPFLAAGHDANLCLCLGPVGGLISKLSPVTTPETRRAPPVAAFVKIAPAGFRSRSRSDAAA